MQKAWKGWNVFGARFGEIEKMIQYWLHFRYLMIHKYFVFLECYKRGIVWRGIMHDMSKFLPSEFGGYANHFFNPDGTRKNNPEKDQVESFKRAWCHHAHHNDHHWNYWVVDTHYESGDEEPVLPTTEAIKEMAADMIGANAAKGNANPHEGARDFYRKNHNRIILHPDARSLLEKELGMK